MTYTRVNDAHSGNFGERVTMTSRKDGDAKLVPLMDLGECSSQVASGRNYEVSAWYKSNVAGLLHAVQTQRNRPVELLDAESTVRARFRVDQGDLDLADAAATSSR